MTAADEPLLGALRRVVEASDPVPADWRRAAQDCFGWAAHDVAVAPVVYDSLDAARPGGGGAPGRRAAGEVRRVGYAVPGGGLEVEMAVGGGGLRVRGRLRPGRAGRVVALWRHGSRATEADRAGAFRFDELPARPLSFLVEGPPRVKTGWIVP